MNAVGKVIVDTAQELGLAELYRVAPICRSQRAPEDYRIKDILAEVFTAAKKEQLVLEDGAAHRATGVVALQVVGIYAWDGRVAGWFRVARPLVSEIVKAIAVETVAAGAGHDIDRTGRSDGCRNIQVGLRDLKFLDRIFGYVLRRRSHVFVGNIDSVHRNARRASKPATKGNRAETILGRVEARAVLDLYPRL